jgi:hypothetical protein
MNDQKKDIFQMMNEEEEYYVKTREEKGFVSIGLVVSSLCIGMGNFYKTYYLYKNVPLHELTNTNIETLSSHNNKYIHFSDTFLDNYEKIPCGKDAYDICKYKLYTIHKNSMFSN